MEIVNQDLDDGSVKLNELSQKFKLIGIDKFNHSTLTISLTCDFKLPFNMGDDL
jgi:hypothetical protein